MSEELPPLPGRLAPGSHAGGLPDRGGDRPGRHGRGLPRLRRPPRPAGGPEGAGPRPRPRRGVPGAVHPGVPDRGGHRAPEHHSGVQRGGGRRCAVHRHALHPRRRRAVADRPGGAAAARPGLRAHRPGRVRAGRGARARAGPPGRQAHQHAAGDLARTSRPDHLYLSDFGLAKPSAAATGLTATGQFFGTVDYVAPEQIQGEPLDGRTDQYALACAAFEMLSGSPPFQRENGMAVISAQLSEPPPSLSARRPGLPAAADRVIAKALAKSPADRYERCLDFAEALLAACRPKATGAGAGLAGVPYPPTQAAMPVTPATVADAGRPGPAQPRLRRQARLPGRRRRLPGRRRRLPGRRRRLPAGRSPARRWLSAAAAHPRRLPPAARRTGPGHRQVVRPAGPGLPG